ncbi:hypothetical protein GWK48_06830 [Metallosphaera tengchongensis]|uniref:Uncharacterized protein n=2 Tax=Metallosphaera tengchongensis TaxID=1532350 RepID=A0A6N0P1B7_9CREN|nr:hypothetical protein GWK48_06830 [Metallosphaera tengchongensis]
MVIWAIIHFYLSTTLIKFLPLVSYFFILDAVLFLVGGAILLIGLRLLYIPTLILTWINYLLLTESRIYPAPILGKPLPAINSFVLGTFVLDIILIVVVTLTLLTSEK